MSDICVAREKKIGGVYLVPNLVAQQAKMKRQVSKQRRHVSV